VPAAWLIENSGFYKGYELGKAGISTNHTLAIVNRGEATAQEIVELKDRIQDSVWARFEIELVPEPIFVGDF
jgi:UDP-N-acetylmuramate dehydrogenase